MDQDRALSRVAQDLGSLGDTEVSHAPIVPETGPRPMPENGANLRARLSLIQRTWGILRHYAGKRSALAVADQGLASFGNFVTNILLIRVLSLDDLGKFGILFEAILFFNSLQAALVVYPLSVRAGALDEREMRRLTTVSLGITTLLAIVLGLVMMGVGAILVPGELAAMAGLALMLWQLQELLRRALIARFRLSAVITGDTVRYLGHAGFLLWLWKHGNLNLMWVFGSMGLASVAGALIQARQLGLIRPGDWILRLMRWIGGFVKRGDLPADSSPRPTRSQPKVDGFVIKLRKEALSFWRLGQWMLYANLTLLISMMGCTWTLLFTHGVAEVGRFTALANILRPTNLVMLGIAGLLTPAVARALVEMGPRAARRTGFSLARLGLVVLIPFFVFLLAMPHQAIHIFNGSNPSFNGLEMHLRVFVIWFFVMYLGTMLSAYLNGLKQSRWHFHAQAMYTAGALFVSIPLTAVYGLQGIIIGGLCATLIQAAACLHYLRLTNAKLEADRVKQIKGAGAR